MGVPSTTRRTGRRARRLVPLAPCPVGGCPVGEFSPANSASLTNYLLRCSRRPLPMGGTAPEPAHSPKCSQTRPHFPRFLPVSRSKLPPTSLMGTDANPCTRVLHQIRPFLVEAPCREPPRVPPSRAMTFRPPIPQTRPGNLPTQDEEATAWGSHRPPSSGRSGVWSAA